jgi:hypothetical protein
LIVFIIIFVSFTVLINLLDFSITCGPPEHSRFITESVASLLERSVVREWDRSWGEPRVISPLKVETETEAEAETETETEAEAETETETEVAMGCVWAVSALPNSDFNIGDAAPMAMAMASVIIMSMTI